jgi:hypothetical protein
MLDSQIALLVKSSFMNLQRYKPYFSIVSFYKSNR